MQCRFSTNNFSCKEIADNSGYCIFHKKNKNDLENKRFIELIKKNKINDFNGFIFDVDFYIFEVIDYFYDEIKFSNVVFNKKAIFDNFKFSKNVIFKDVEFLGEVSFNNCIFENECSFYNLNFNENYINEKIFYKTLFYGQNFIINKCLNLPRLDSIKFDDNTKIIMSDVNYYENQYLTGKINYRIAKNQADKIGDYDRRDFYYCKEREYSYFLTNKNDYLSNTDYRFEKIFNFLEKYIIGYRKKSFRVFIISIFIISMFAFFYCIAGVKTLNNELIYIDFKNIGTYSVLDIFKIYFEMWYFSLVTFSTLGYGDVIPYNSFGKILTITEVFTGIGMVAIWTSLIIKRMIK